MENSNPQISIRLRLSSRLVNPLEREFEAIYACSDLGDVNFLDELAADRVFCVMTYCFLKACLLSLFSLLPRCSIKLQKSQLC